MDTTFRTIRLDHEKRLEPKQIVMQCNLDTSSKGGVSKVCFLCGDVLITKAQALSKQIKVSGKATIKVVYLNEEGKLQSFDYISDFVEDIVSDWVTADSAVRVTGSVLDSESAAGDGEIKIQLVIQLDPCVIERKSGDYLTEAEGALNRTQTVRETEFLRYCEETCEVSEEFDTGAVVDNILLFDSRAVVERLERSGGVWTVSGRVQCAILYESDGKCVPKNLFIPFGYELADEGEIEACLTAKVKDSKMIISGTDKDNVLRAEVTLEIGGAILRGEDVEVVCDLFCPECATEAQTERYAYTRKEGLLPFNESIGGVAQVPDSDAGIRRLIAATAVSGSVANIAASDEAVSCEGLAMASVLYESESGEIESVQIELPFSLRFDAENVAGKTLRAEALPCELNAKVKRDREIEISVNLLIVAEAESACEMEAVVAVEEGESIPVSRNAVTVYLPEKGESMWDVCKELGMPAAEIQAQNPYLGQVMEGGEVIVVYRELLPQA